MKTLFLGDVSPSRIGKEPFRNKEIETLFKDTIPMMMESEFTCVNLECALTERTTPIKKMGPPLCAPLETAEVLKKLNVSLCSLSNNHSFDYGVDGMKDTFEALSKAGLDYTGFGDNYEDSRKNYVIEKDGQKIAIIAVCEHEYTYALDDRMGARPFDEFDTVQDVIEARKSADRVIVLYHGGKEYSMYPSPRLYKLCHTMAKCGADMILCQHSHCIGCYEEYEGCHILYGQGNFHFLSNSPKEGWYTSLAVQYDTKSDEINFVPIRVLDDGICLASGEDKKNILKKFEARSETLKNGKWIDGWREFCESEKAYYIEKIRNACNEDSSEAQNEIFGHFLDCEAHTDVWREIFKTWNHTNEK